MKICEVNSIKIRVKGGCKHFKNKTIFLKEILPEGVCAVAYHSAFPYLLGFKFGSWFRWEKNKNKVTALCPYAENPIVMDIFKNSEIKIRKDCSKYKNNFKINEKTCSSVFDSVYPLLFLKDSVELSCVGCEEGKINMKIMKNKKVKSICDICNDLDNVKIKVVGWKRKCRYHKRLGQIFNINEIIPKGMCLFSYHSIYPYALSLLYDGKINNKNYVDIDCPCVDNIVKMRVLSEKRRFSFMFNFIEAGFRILGIPQDIVDKKIKMKVINARNCPKGLKINDRFEFNINNKKELCPASFDNILASILLKDYKNILQCPSENCMIKYKILEG